MRILFADQFSETGGAQLALLDILDEVTRRGWQSELMAPGAGPLHKACTDRGIPSLPLPYANYSNGRKTLHDAVRYGIDTARAAGSMCRALVRFKPDLIYANGPRVLPAAVVAAQFRRCELILHLHSYLDRGYSRQIARWCVSSKQVRVLTISNFTAQPFAGLAKNRQLQTVYNGVRDYGFFLRPRPGPVRIGILGRISKQKGHLDFVQAARQITAIRPEVRFLIFGAAMFGDGPCEQDVRAAAQGVPVEFRGWTNDVAAALHEIDVLAVPSGASEGATRVIMEAFSAGTPVVAYPSGGIPELITDGHTGLLAGTCGHQALAKALEDLLENPGLAERLSLQGRNEWEARFRQDRFQREVCDFIEEPFVASRVAKDRSTTSGAHSAPREPVS